nr:acyltransferase family protein [Microbacterium enclense]
MTSRPAGLAAWAGLAAVVGAGFAFTSSTPFPGVTTLLPVLGTAALIVGGSASTRWSPAAILSVRPMLFLGAISYSLYLVHWPLQQIPQSAVGYENPLPLVVTLGLGVLAVPLAWLSFRFVEEPFRTSPQAKRARTSTTLWATAAASAIVVAASSGLIVVANQTPISSGRPVEAGSNLSTPPVVPSFVPSNIAPPLRTAADDNAVIYSDGCHQEEGDTDTDGCWFGDNADAPSVVLFGDSHAASWFPTFDTLAEAGDIRLNSNTKSSCGSVLLAEERVKRSYPACDQWRRGVIERLQADPPTVIVLANFASARLGREADPAAAWEEALQRTVAELPSSSRVVVMADTADFGVTPGMCLAAHVEDTEACAVPRDEALDEPVRAVERETQGIDWIDLTDRMCDDVNCYPVVDDFLVTRDAHHLTKTFAEALAPALRERLPLG